MQPLRDPLPAPTFPACVSAGARAEVLDSPSPRVEVRRIGHGAAAWALTLLGAGLRGPVPTLLIASPDRMGEARRLGKLLPLCDCLVVPSMNHLALALRSLGGEGAPGR